MSVHKKLLTNYVKKELESLRLNSGKNLKLLVGLSGGPDSVCLTHILKELSESQNFSLAAAHMDHGWRADSHKDRELSEQLCRDLGIEFFTGHAKEFENQTKHNGSKEETARLIRRAFFQATLKKTGSDFVVLAHHAQDQIETFLIRLIRGSSLTGLASMKAFNEVYFRPMLECPKNWIDQYLKEETIRFITDPTNLSSDFLRNRIRNKVIPELEQVDSRFWPKALETVKNLQAEDSVLEKLASQFTEKNNGNLKIKDFLSLEKPLQMRVLTKMMIKTGKTLTPSQGLFQEAIKFLSHERGGTHQLTTHLTITKKGTDFWID